MLNCGLDVVRQGNGMDSRSHKVEPMLGKRAAHGHPTARFGTVKNSPNVLVGLKMSMCFLHEIPSKMNGLNCVEINMLMHEFNVLT